MAIAMESNVVIDLESCPKAMGEGFTTVGEGKNLSNKAFSCFVGSDASLHGEDLRFGSRKCCAEGRMDTLDALISENRVGVEEKVDKEVGAQKTKKKGCKKPPKPPRPPRPLSLDCTDQKIIREISELANLKRARVERIKALKKMKNAKTASSSHVGNIFALVVTVVFCAVIIWQGVFSRGSLLTTFQGSLVPSVKSSSYISLHFYSNDSKNAIPSSSLPSSVI